MGDERVAEEPVDAISRLSAELEELRLSLSSRVVRRPTGDFELTMRKTPKADTIFLTGQTLSRTDYPNLWQWAQEQDLVQTGMFTVGDGSTTFGVPNFQGRFIIAAGTLGSDVYDVGKQAGAATKVILPANMAAHTHQVQIRDHMSNSGQTAAEVGSPTRGHNHESTGAAGGNHGDHNHTNLTVAIGAAGSSYVLRTATTGFGNNAHSHGTGGENQTHDHYLYIPPHSVTEVVVGTNTPLDIRPPYVALNYMMWT